jgi:hypothetical protein
MSETWPVRRSSGKAAWDDTADQGIAARLALLDLSPMSAERERLRTRLAWQAAVQASLAARNEPLQVVWLAVPWQPARMPALLVVFCLALMLLLAPSALLNRDAGVHANGASIAQLGLDERLAPPVEHPGAISTNLFSEGAIQPDSIGLFTTQVEASGPASPTLETAFPQPVPTPRAPLDS